MAITQATQLADFTSGIGTAGAILEVDNVNNKIGIGTTNPQALLQVGQIIKMDGPSGIITATTFSGNFTGNITGNATGLSGTPNITVNNIIGVGATFTGVVTYEDVTNVDSIGIVTARSGIHVDDSITHINDTNTKIRFPSADTFTVETSGVERLRVGSTGTVGVAGLSTATSFGAFNHLSAPFGGGTVTYTVTVASKTADHRYNGSGSGNAYLIDGVQSPFLTLTPGRTYRFTNDNTGSHPLKFYLEADKTTLYSTGVTFDNSYTEIVVSDSTPQVLHYQCTNHSLMGNAVQTNSNIADTATNASGLTGTPNISCGTGAFSGVVTLQNNLDLQDNDQILLGTGDDLQINHDSSNSFIDNYTGTFVLRNYADDSDILLSSDDGSGGVADYIRCDGSAGSVILGHYGSTKFETTSGGVNVTGELECDSLDVDGAADITGAVTLHGNLDLQDNDKILLGTGDDLEIYHDGTDNFIKSNTALKIQAAGSNSYSVHISARTDKETIKCYNNTNAPYVELFYDNSKKFETTSGGISVTGEIVASGQAQFKGAEGASAYLYLYADEGDDNADKFRLQVADGGPFTIQNFTSGSWETNIECNGNGNVELYHDNSKKLETSSAGVTVTGTLNATTALTQDGKGLATTGKAIAMAMVFG